MILLLKYFDNIDYACNEISNYISEQVSLCPTKDDIHLSGLDIRICTLDDNKILLKIEKQ